MRTRHGNGPALAACRERCIDPRDTWGREVLRWGSEHFRSANLVAWPVFLMPDADDIPDAFMKVQSLATFCRFRWSGSPPDRPFVVTSELAWAPHQGLPSDLAIHTRGSSGSNAAELLWVARGVDPSAANVSSQGPDWAVPCCPRAKGLRSRHTFVFGEDEIRDLARLSNVRHLLHEDLSFAWRAGFPGLVVPGLLQLVVQLRFARVGAYGSAEIWFRRPVIAGAALQLCRSDGDPELWALRYVGTGALASIMRVRKQLFVSGRSVRLGASGADLRWPD
jgi:hypothetical protein